MVRDDELQRLINYAKGLGLTVSFTSKEINASAMWYIDNSGIVISKNNNTTKIETILSLIHELGHALQNVHEKNRQIDTKVEKALDHIDEAEELGVDAKKRQRKILLDDEIAGTKYWHEIYKETNMKFPLWRLKVAMEYDIWNYEVLYETGSHPSTKEKVEKKKALTAKHKTKE